VAVKSQQHDVEAIVRQLNGSQTETYDVDGLISKPNEQGVSISIREHCHGLDTHSLGRLHDTNGDLTSVGNEDFLEKLEHGKVKY
jgi:hypothetical protein